MATPPMPKPRTGLVSTNSEPLKKPVPLPRTKLPTTSERVTSSASEILQSIGNVSKQLSEDVANKVQNSAKSVNEKLEKSFMDGSKFAKGTLEKTITTSRAMRDSVTKSVIEGTKTAGLRLRRSKKSIEGLPCESQRCMSMPDVDMKLFDNIQFHSPLLEHKWIRSEGQSDLAQSDQVIPSMNLNCKNFDDLSLFSNNSDSNTDTVSTFSHDSRDYEYNRSGMSEGEQLTYDTPKASRANSVVGESHCPEIPERRKKRESVDFMRQNSLYENWNLPGEPLLASPEVTSRPSKSTIFEFDPLNTATSKYEGVSNELLLLESYLTGDTYGTITATDGSEDNFEDFSDKDYFNPPTPPERTDSLFDTESENKADTAVAAGSKDNNSNWFTDEDGQSKPDEVKIANTTGGYMQRFSNMLKLDNMLNKSSKQNAPKVEVVERPGISVYVHYYSGMLSRLVSGPSGVEELFKNSLTRHCVLSDQKLMCYSDATNTVLKETYALESVLSIQISLPLSSSSTHNYCFELSLTPASPRGSPRKIVFSSSSQSDRQNWAQKIAEHLTSGFQPKYTAEFTRCGWCYLKEGVSGEWQGAWVMLIRRVLVYHTKDGALRTVDLRKTRCVVSQNADEETKKCCPNDGGGNLLLDCSHATLYLRFPYERELKGWRYMVKLAAHNNGAYLHHQQLTQDDVPALVDKCISFIYAHGSMTEGIYRRAGSSSVLSTLLANFRRDAWSVQLSARGHSEHDVAGVLKRFFRDLPEPLLPQEKHQALVSALVIEDEKARQAEFRRLMLDLPVVARRTARKLFAHLHFIHTMAAYNKMAADNLAAVWAPTIMPAAVTSDQIQTAWSSKEVFVVRDLIAHYEAIWEPTEAEKRREAAVRRVLLRVTSQPAPSAPKAAGDLKAWVYVHDRSTCFQVSLTPSKTSADICVELCEKANAESHLLMLEEVVCNEAMRRTVHIDEIVLDVVLRWGYWDEEDRKDNYIVVRENKVLYDMEALRHKTSLVCGELKFASEANKAFKMYMFELKNGKLCYFKDKQGSHLIEEWNLKDILWYTGHETKRNPQTRWAITFIPRNNKQKRSKDRPWFGCTIGGAVTEDQLKWMTAMMFAEHPNVLPTPRLVIT
ncbi:arf-GAP with Rho-GAP domain, ANK repeat and PH domain-containing protein 2 [Plutella xylostella]|uniref:arf-GAP with Rho-GAP domain, ANK repeat and PH domain-containing protein 2 n=1 Tax=Plutella xylostella TaxID=51655 RepID=UPI002032E6EA|nr:arf-GAP with Rho-GAP domain, ANK repeat and PH domain-containing protein 2 [Plutella xylostella]